MKRHFFALLMSLAMMISLLPVTAMANDDESETPSEVTDIDGHVWQVATEDNTITMTSKDEKTTITLMLDENKVLTVTGNGAMPNLDPSTDSTTGKKSEYKSYPWWDSFKDATKIVIRDGITSVGAKSFITWSAVEEVVIGKDVESIGAGAFGQLTACEKFTVAENNEYFNADENGILYSADGTKLYYYPCALTAEAIEVPAEVTTLGYNAICKNHNVKRITFARTDDLTLGYGSLAWLTSLKEVRIKAEKVALESSVFSNDSELQAIYCANADVKNAITENASLIAFHGYVFIEGEEGFVDGENGFHYVCNDGEATIIAYDGSTGNDVELAIPNKVNNIPVTRIASGVFKNLEFKSVDIPESVTSIEAKAFLQDSGKYTNSLKNVKIRGENVTLGSEAFFRNQKMTIDLSDVKDIELAFRSISEKATVIVSAEALDTMKEALARMMDQHDEWAHYTDFKVYVDTKSENEPYWTYSKAEQKWSYTNGSISVQAEGYNDNYDGAAHSITVTAAEGINITYSTDGTNYNEENPTFTNAGTYKVYFKASKDSNDLVGFAYVTIAKIEPQLTIIAIPDSLRGGGKVTLTVTGVPEEGNVTVTCDNGITVDSENGTYSAVLPNRTVSYTFTANYDESTNYTATSAKCEVSVTRRYSSPSTSVTPEPEPTPEETVKFSDVSTSAYYYDAVKWAVENGVTDGVSATLFAPYEPCTRGQIVTFLWRAAGSPEPKTASSFADVPASAYYAKAVAWAVENGITNGMTETTFAPDATCTRGQSVTFLYRALKGTASGSTNFTDVASDVFYADAVNWAVASDVTNGTSNTTFSPNADCTRAEIVTFLYRAYQGK